MKFTTTSMTTFYVSSAGIISQIEHDLPIVSFRDKGKQIIVNGSTYNRFKAGDKYLYVQGDIPNSISNIEIPGSDIRLHKSATYAIPKEPEEDEWNLQSICLIINTDRLRTMCLELVPALTILNNCLKSKAVNVLDANGNRSIADVVEKPLAKLIKQLEELTEATAQNFKP